MPELDKVIKHLDRHWPTIAPILSPVDEARREGSRRTRPPLYGEDAFFKALLRAAWEGKPLRGHAEEGPCGGGLYQKLQRWRDTDQALENAMTCYAELLPRYLQQAWRKRLTLHDRAVRENAKSHPAAWLMVNRFWYDAVARPLLETGKR